MYVHIQLFGEVSAFLMLAAVPVLSLVGRYCIMGAATDDVKKYCEQPVDFHSPSFSGRQYLLQ